MKNGEINVSVFPTWMTFSNSLRPRIWIQSRVVASEASARRELSLGERLEISPMLRHRDAGRRRGRARGERSHDGNGKVRGAVGVRGETWRGGWRGARAFACTGLYAVRRHGASGAMHSKCIVARTTLSAHVRTHLFAYLSAAAARRPGRMCVGRTVSKKIASKSPFS